MAQAPRPAAARAAAALLLALALLAPRAARACTRVLYTGANSTVISGRSLDWMDDSFPSLWAMPRGVARSGETGPGSFNWTSKFGSLVVSMYDIAVLEGINEKGLTGNGLYLAESDYGKLNGKPGMSITVWVQYVLDTFATVKEAIDSLQSEPFRIVAPVLPNGRPATGHLSLSDPTGDSAILEYIGGKLVIHHGPQYRVMTNSPTYDKQMAIEEYWKGVGGQAFLPGSIRAADRYVRATWMLDNIPKDIDKHVISAVPNTSFEFQAIASVRGVMQAVSVPLGVADPKLPNIASTFWRTVIDHKNKVLLYDSATSPNSFWVVLDDLDLSAGAPVRQLPLTGRVYAGNTASQFAPAAKPLKFMGATPK
ncbi:hydrolase [Raphidocelis subcapitata]|uniref:Hydrolase n=1 Tax=Raphidocelis subcapitata TaxID=307507 RepID=A0A2V0NTK0_9CHLO|nr:hydrolase [Raphidocelis subcapitata]|eukprot:GBF90639.1 hydrolase [Raphidocelis subcapitata]